MSDDLVARLRSIVIFWAKGRHTPAFIKQTVAVAAHRIEQLEAERATLAEIVRLLDVSVEPCEEGETAWWLVTDNWFDYSLTPERAERFQRVLDRITKETSDE